VQDLAHHTLISVQDVPDYWAMVARGHGFEISKRLVFSTFEETLHAARHGMGVTMALLPLMQPWLDSHGLVAPLPVRWEGPHFYLVYRPEDRELRGIRVLYECLRQAFGARALRGGAGVQVERD
jgi:DNA-binding transcriptional LysR family regulator